MLEINEHLYLEFKSLIIDNITSKLQIEPESNIIADGVNIGNAIQLILNYFPMQLANLDSVIKEIYVLYVFSYLLRTYLNTENSNLLEKVYYPNLIYLLAYFLKKASKFFQKTIRSIYNQSKDKLEKSILFYITFYNSEYIVIKNDIINIFLNSMIFDINPLEIKSNYKEYYSSIFQYIFYLYLDRQSNGSIDHEISFNSSDQDNTLSSRYNIYKNGIRRTQIQLMCNESSTLKKIYSNFNQVKNDIIVNEFQKLYSIIIDKDSLVDSKMLILKFNMEDENLLNLSSQFPLIYKLLRSIKINSPHTIYTNYDKILIKEALKDSIYLKLHKYISEDHALILSETMALRLQQSITEGLFLDPYTLTTLEVRGNLFLKQLTLFINMILDHVDAVNNLEFGI